MAKKNLNSFTTFVNMYNLQAQKVKFTDNAVQIAVINGMVFNKLDNMNEDELRCLLKGIASGEVTQGNCKRLDATCKRIVESMGVHESKVKNKSYADVQIKGSSVNINGNYYRLFDVVKDLTLADIERVVNELFQDEISNRKQELYNKFRNWWNTIGSWEWLIYKITGDLDTGVNVEDLERV